jgi:FMN phosphatase YigB (HAD superfamily)
LYIGDSFDCDVEGARRCGMRSLWLRRTSIDPADEQKTKSRRLEYESDNAQNGYAIVDSLLPEKIQEKIAGFQSEE